MMETPAKARSQVVPPPGPAASGIGAGPRSPRAVLGTCAATHFLHDGLTDLVYLLLPLWRAEFALTLGEVGLMKSCLSAAIAAFQVPFGLLAERWGERGLLAAGTALAALAYLALGAVGGALGLAVVLAAAGTGASVQHPLCAATVSRAYEGGGHRAALGVYNFAGDLGKMAFPALAALILVGFGWRAVTTGYGVVALAAAVAVYVALAALGAGARPGRARAVQRGQAPVPTPLGWGIVNRRGFTALAAIGVLDSATRTAFLTLLPFLLIAKGAAAETVGVALAITFAGGATGKFLCGMLAERFGIIATVILTEVMTGGGILILLALPLGAGLVALAVIGAALNGTSSVLYGTLAELIDAKRRSRGFGLFYTIGIGASAVAPTVFGWLSDVAGVPATLAMVAACALATLPVAPVLRASLTCARR